MGCHLFQRLGFSGNISSFFRGSVILVSARVAQEADYGATFQLLGYQNRFGTQKKYERRDERFGAHDFGRL